MTAVRDVTISEGHQEQGKFISMTLTNTAVGGRALQRSWAHNGLNAAQD